MEQRPLFVIDPSPVVDWPVIVRLPADGGTFEEYQFTAKFRVLAADEYAALEQARPKAPAAAVDSAADAAPAPAAPAPAPTMQEILQDNARQFAALVAGWSEIKDVARNDVPFTAEKLAAEVTGPRGAELSAGLWLAIREIRCGARLKNFVPPSVAGSAAQ